VLGADGAHDEFDRDAFDAVEFSDEELAQLALEALPFDPFGPDVEQFGDRDVAQFPVLPEWYMPAPGIVRSRSRAAVMFGFAIALLIINVGGFCVTWGFPEFVWK
jgi:hypothetical protein